MKRSFRIAKVLLACLIITHFFVSCHEKNEFDGKHSFKSGKPLKGDIHIIDYSTDGTLTLIDDNNNNAIYAQVARSQKIKWVVDHDDDKPDLDNLQIDSIYADPKFPNPPDFFSELPAANGNHWAATINGDSLDTTKGFLEKYIIVWHIKGNSKSYSCDPIMQINPK